MSKLQLYAIPSDGGGIPAFVREILGKTAQKQRQISSSLAIRFETILYMSRKDFKLKEKDSRQSAQETEYFLILLGKLVSLDFEFFQGVFEGTPDT